MTNSSGYASRIRIRQLATSLIVLGLVGCTTPPPKSSLPADSTLSGTAQSIEHNVDDPAVAALWTSAELARGERKYAEAQGYIEQALRVVPDDPVLHCRLAELTMKQGENVLAENYAAKSNALASENNALQYRNWLIIQHSRDQRGDVLGAREAQVQARRYSAE